MQIGASLFADIMIALHVFAALCGLGIGMVLSLRLGGVLVNSHRGARVATLRGLNGWHIAAIGFVFCSSASLILLNLESLCVPGDEPMILRMDLRRLPSRTLEKLMLSGTLVVCAVLLESALAAGGAAGRGQSSQAYDVGRMAILTSIGTAIYVCWLSLAIVALVPAVQGWAPLSVMSVIGATWLGAAIVVFAMAWLSRRPWADVDGSLIAGMPVTATPLFHHRDSEADVLRARPLRAADISGVTIELTQEPASGRPHLLVRLEVTPLTGSSFLQDARQIELPATALVVAAGQIGARTESDAVSSLPAERWPLAAGRGSPKRAA